MNTFNITGGEPETAAHAVSRHLAKIREADAAGPGEARCSTTEAVMVALALCNRAYLPASLHQTHAGHLWWRLDASQREAIHAYGDSCSKGGAEVASDRLC